MKETILDASWIWRTENEQPDTYCDFKDTFQYAGGDAVCHISCDGDYTLFVNGVYAGSNQYGDFEHYKIYDSIDITRFLSPGENTLLVTVWHLGIASSRYKPAKAGLIYEVECGGKLLCKSNAQTLCRQNPNYRSGYCKQITPQLGQSFLYDSTSISTSPYQNSTVIPKQCILYPRPIRKSLLLEPQKAIVILAQENSYLLDLGDEYVGLPTLDFCTETAQKITVCWGEHILDGGVRRRIGNRDFSFEYIAAKGKNTYTNYMLRLGCRYLEIFFEAPIQLNYIGIIPQVYPVEVTAKTFEEPLKQKIYDMCVHTLKRCMMERYVDTPWREQAFYVYDSRNQMLCGYKAFKNGNSRYARAGLLLLSQDNRSDGLLSLTCPNGSNRAIPSFSLHYFTAVREYLDNTNDLSLATAVYDRLLKIIHSFETQMRDGLLHPFQDNRYWNFYDWSAYMNKTADESGLQPDLMMNCLYLLALDNFKIISEKIGKPFRHQEAAAALRIAIRIHFFDPESGLYSMTEGLREFTELGNAVAILAGVASEEESRQIAKKLSHNLLESCSLSMKCFKYDALLKVDPQYHADITREICDTYRVMLDSGSSTVWEVVDGAHAFEDAGSLCHGWSAIPIVYL